MLQEHAQDLATGLRCRWIPAFRAGCFVLVSTVLQGMAALPAAQPAPSPIPLEKGTRWIYEAKVRWTPVGAPGTNSGRFRWTATIVDCFEGKSARAAVIHAWPDDVAGMDPAQPAGYDVLLETGTIRDGQGSDGRSRLYRFRAKGRRDALRLARRLAAAPEPLPKSAVIYLELPLAVGQRWGEDADSPRRDDGWYCWRVEARAQQSISIPGFPSSEGAVFTVAYRTGPDEQVLEIAPGLGITRFRYEHHGTVAGSDVRLVEFKRPSLAQGLHR